MGFVCSKGMEGFLVPIMEYRTGHKVRRIGQSVEEVQRYIDYTDVFFFEWLNQENCSLINKVDFKGKMVVVRLHRYEVLTQTIREVNWDKVDLLILVSENVREDFDRRIPHVLQFQDIEIVPNGVDLEVFVPMKKKPGFNIGFSSSHSLVKQPTVAFFILKELLEKYDTRYVINWAETYTIENMKELNLAAMKGIGIESNVRLCGVVEDMNQWYSQQNVLLHTSIIEGHCVTILECMSKQLPMVVFPHKGSEVHIPKQHMFYSISQAVDMVHRYAQSTEDYSYLREFIIKKGYTLKDQAEHIYNAIEERFNRR